MSWFGSRGSSFVLRFMYGVGLSQEKKYFPDSGPIWSGELVLEEGALEGVA